jgi:ATP-dependent helicase/nuclease subunit A
LIICGAKGVNKAPSGCWHDLVLSALTPLSEEASDGDGRIWRFRKGDWTVPDDGPRAAEKPIALPSWLTTNTPPSPTTVKVLRPSDTADDEPRRVTGGGDRALALLRGSLVHRLLQSLPDIPAARRRKVADDYLVPGRRQTPG